MDKLVSNKNMWLRRTAMIHQLGYKDKTDTNRLFNFALCLAHENEFFIQKSIGWALRDYAHYNDKLVIDFLKKRKSELSKLSYLEAAKHLIIN